MKKFSLFAIAIILLGATFTSVPKTYACAAAVCEDISGCIDCVFYGALFTDCIAEDCDRCANFLCDNLALSPTTTDNSSQAQLNATSCGEETELQPRIEVLHVEVLPARV